MGLLPGIARIFGDEKQDTSRGDATRADKLIPLSQLAEVCHVNPLLLLTASWISLGIFRATFNLILYFSARPLCVLHSSGLNKTFP